MTKHRETKLAIAHLMDSPKWAYLTEDDHHHLMRVATVCFRHPERGPVLAIHWSLYLVAAKGRIAIRKHERMASGRPHCDA